MAYARIVNGAAVDISADPAKQFHPALASEFVAVPVEVRAGWVLDGDVWQAPASTDVPAEPEPAPEPVQQYKLQMSPVEFKMLLTPSERLAIRTAREYTGDDEARRTLAYLIDDWWLIVDDSRLSEVNLALAQVQEGLDMLVTAGILTAERRAEVGLGLPVAG